MDRRSQSHAAWDGGAISDNPFFRAALPQKTVKTECGMRVSLSRIDNADPKCARCLAEIAMRNAAMRGLQAEFDRLATAEPRKAAI